MGERIIYVRHWRYTDDVQYNKYRDSSTDLKTFHGAVVRWDHRYNFSTRILRQWINTQMAGVSEWVA